MLQHSSLPPTPTADIAEIAGSLQRSWDAKVDRRRWQSLQELLPLPTTWQQYLFSCLVLAIIMAGMGLHILLSVQIARTDLQVRQMRTEYAAIQRRNSELVYAIAQRSSLAQMAQLAAEKGYVPATGRTYVLRSSEAPTASTLAPAGNLPTGDVPTGITPAGAPAPAAPDADWLVQLRQWWQETQQTVTSAANQLWRDVTGRME